MHCREVWEGKLKGRGRKYARGGISSKFKRILVGKMRDKSDTKHLASMVN